MCVFGAYIVKCFELSTVDEKKGAIMLTICQFPLAQIMDFAAEISSTSIIILRSTYYLLKNMMMIKMGLNKLVLSSSVNFFTTIVVT